MPIVRLGNTAPIDTKKLDEKEDKVERIPLDRERSVTFFKIPEDYNLLESFTIVVKTFDGYHSDDPPAWVESDNEGLEFLVKEHYSNEDHEVLIGEPDDWEVSDAT